MFAGTHASTHTHTHTRPYANCLSKRLRIYVNSAPAAAPAAATPATAAAPPGSKCSRDARRPGRFSVKRTSESMSIVGLTTPGKRESLGNYYYYYAVVSASRIDVSRRKLTEPPLYGIHTTRVNFMPKKFLVKRELLFTGSYAVPRRILFESHAVHRRDSVRTARNP